LPIAISVAHFDRFDLLGGLSFNFRANKNILFLEVIEAIPFLLLCAITIIHDYFVSFGNMLE
jgi:hypothetical protein